MEGVTLTMNDVLEPVTQKRERGIQAEIELVQGELNMVHVGEKAAGVVGTQGVRRQDV